MLTIYKASAGSGKTFTLTFRYIKLLLGYKDETGRYRLRRRAHSNHRAILAVTFTNKATDEMKRRIVHELAVLGGMEPGWEGKSPYASMLTEQFGCSLAELAEASRSALRNLLFDFNFFQVSTIDSFFQVILRTFAREAELTGNYEVDIENDRAMEAGVRNLFDSLRVDSGSPDNARMIEWITQFLLNELREGRGVSIFNRRSEPFKKLMNFVRQTDSEAFKAHYDEMMDYLSSPEKIAAFRQQLASASSRHRQLTSQACRQALDHIASCGYDQGKAVVAAKVLTRLSDGALNGYDTSKKQGKTIVGVLDDPMSAFNKKLRTMMEADPDEALLSNIITAATYLDEGWRFRPLWAALTKQIYILGLLEGIYRYIEAFRAENNTFLLSDTNSILKEIIGDGDTPFVFERIGVWLNHFLIDEFQDTSRMQWEIMRPLVMEGQATDCDSLIIGDEKQCIYRFRSSDPTLLQHTVMADFGERACIEGNTPEGNTNWRSSAHVVTFNNELFSRLSQSLGLQAVYSNVCQQVSAPHTSHAGYVCANAVTLSGRGLAPFYEEALRIMASSIRRQLEAGYKGKDICVLVRKRSHGVMVIDHLVKLIAADSHFKGLRVISDDAMMLGASPAVRLIISVLRHIAAIESATNGEDAGEGMRVQRMARIDAMLNRVEYLRSQGFSANHALTEAIEHPDRHFDLKADLTGMTCFNLPSLVERVIGRMLKSELDSQCMYISAFQDVVSDFCSSGNADLNSFLEWWDSKGNTATVSAPDDENAIRVMTIHKSKGLEFSCVHVPMLVYPMVDFKGQEWFTKAQVPMVDSALVPPLLSLKPSKALEATAFGDQYRCRCNEQLLDELNILYVALTRAADELCITYLSPAKESESYPVGAVLDRAIPAMDLIEKVEMADVPDPEADSEVSVATYVYGVPTLPQPEKVKKPTALDPVATFGMPPYRTADRDDLWAYTRVDDLPDFNVARDRGIMLHDVLSKVRHVGSLHHAVAVAVHSGSIPAELAPEIEEFLGRELARPDVRPWFDGFRRAVSERSFLIKNEGTLRADRVVWTADGHTDVIDYKFGEPRKSHRLQVQKYMQTLSGMGHPNVRGFLWYVSKGNIIKI